MMILTALAATFGIVVQDQSSLRTEPRASATQATALSQGDVVEIRGERADYLKVYEYRRERGGYLRRDAVRPIGFTEADAPELLGVMRFLRDRPGSESLGISYGAAYLKAVPSKALTAEPFDAIGRMAERLADSASGTGARLANAGAHLEVVKHFGVRMNTFERSGRMQVCYDGELFRRVISTPRATAEQRAHAALGLTRPDCIEPNLGPALRAPVDADRRELLDGIDARSLGPVLRSRLHARRAVVWASHAFEQARRREDPQEAAERALSELLAVSETDLGDDRKDEYVDAVLRVSAVRWAAAPIQRQTGPLTLTTSAGEPGQTCIALQHARPAPRSSPLVQRCTYGIVWMASVQAIWEAPALVLAVQPLESWRELWVFHQRAGKWSIDVLSPGTEDPESGYIEFAGFAPGTKRLLVAREVKDRGRFHRRFEVLRLDDLALVRHASTPDLLRDFGRWQDVAWRRDTLALH
jgi:hypothetical protein